MSLHIKKYNDFKESVMIPQDQNTNKKKSKFKMDFRTMCSWDEITYRPPGFFSRERKFKIYYSPLRNTILSIEPQMENVPLGRGDSKNKVIEWVESEPKAEITNFFIKRYKGSYE